MGKRLFRRAMPAYAPAATAGATVAATAAGVSVANHARIFGGAMPHPNAATYKSDGAKPV